MPGPVSYTHLDVYKRQVHNREYELIGYAEAGNASFSYSLLQEGTNYLDRTITDELFFRSAYLTTLEFVTPQYWSNEGEKFISCLLYPSSCV